MKPTLVDFSGKLGYMLSFVLIMTCNAPIPTMKIRQKQYKTVFYELICAKLDAI